MTFLLNAYKDMRHPEERFRRGPEVRLEGRTLPMQRRPAQLSRRRRIF
jgi:hypothetical protein